MNHILTQEDLVNDKNLHTAVFISMMEDLGMYSESLKTKKTLKNWIPKFRGVLEYFQKIEFMQFTTFRPIDPKTAIEMWAVGNLETWNIENTIRFRERQLKYNLALKRWLDVIYANGDAILSAAIVALNPGLVADLAARGGLTNDESANAENVIRERCDIILNQLENMLLSDYTLFSESHHKLEGIWTEIYKEDVS